MDDGLLSLKWNNHKTTFFEILKSLRDKANYTDATLAVEGKFFPVHKLVLSTCSEYFSEIFERTPCKSPVVVLKDVRWQDLESLLDYMYLGEVNVNQNDLALLLKTAECLRIKGLAVPDDDPVRHSSASSHNKNHSVNTTDDVTKDIPPPAKRRKEDNSSSSAPSTLSPSRNSSSSSRAPPSSPSHLSSHSNKNLSTSTVDASSSKDHQSEVPLVKIEMEENEDGEEAFNNSDTNYDSSGIEPEGRGADFSVDKAEHDPSTYPNANFSSQHTAEMQWEDGENSFPQESFPGDSSSQQTGAARAGMEPLGIVQVDLSSSGGDGGGGSTCGGRSSSSERSVRPLLVRKRRPQQQHQKLTSASEDVFSNTFSQFEDDDLISAASSLHPNLQAQTVGDYPCMYCGKLFFYPSSLEKHVRTHTGEKPFRCNHCAYCASQKSHLKTHMLRKHNVALGGEEERAGEKEN